MRAGKHQKLAEWYRQLGQSLDAGIPLVQSLEQIEPPIRKIQEWPSKLKLGEDLDQILEDSEKILPMTDLLLLSAGRETGRLVPVLYELASMHEDACEMRKSIVSALIYPLFVLNMVLLSFPLYPIGNSRELGAILMYPRDFFTSVGLTLLTFWGGFFLLSRLSVVWKPVGSRMPGFRKFLKHSALARFAEVLEGFISSGVSMEKAWGGAALCSGGLRLEKEALSILPEIKRGRSPGEFIDQIPSFPSAFRQMYRTGEKTGQLPENLAKLAAVHRREAIAGIKSAAFWYPKLLFLIIAIIIAFAVMQGFDQYLEQLNF